MKSRWDGLRSTLKPDGRWRPTRLWVAALVVGVSFSASSLLFAARQYLFVYNGQPIATIMGDGSESYVNCYYGDDGNGNPTGVSSFALGDTAECDEENTTLCIGTMAECDCQEGFGDTSGCE